MDDPLRPPRSDLKPYGNDRLGDHPQAGVVVAGVPAYELVGLFDGDRVLVGSDPLGLFDDDARIQRLLQLLAELLLPACWPTWRPATWSTPPS